MNFFVIRCFVVYQQAPEVISPARRLLKCLLMKRRLGMDHVGLGTDGGGHLPNLIDGYRDVRDLVKLHVAMQEIGFSQEEIGAYMGGNFFRVLKRCIGA